MQSMTMNVPAKPWYRQPLVWMLIAIPFSAVVMGVIMAWLAVDTDDGLVVDDYYKQGLAINQVLERDETATQLGLAATLQYDPASRTVHLVLERGELAGFPQTLTLSLKHATLAHLDRSLTLQRGIVKPGQASYFAVLQTPLKNGGWYFEIEDPQWRLVRRVNLQGAASIRFKALP